LVALLAWYVYINTLMLQLAHPQWPGKLTARDLRALTPPGRDRVTLTATCWHSNKFLNPARDGAVLPAILGREFRVAQAVAIYSRVTFCSYSYSASRCLTKSPIDTRPTSLSWRMTGRWRNRPLVIFSIAT